MVTRQQFVVEARKWLGTPFMHQGRTRGRGVDCVGLVLSVMHDLHLNRWWADAECSVYPRFPVGRRVHEMCQERLTEKPIAQRQPGDVLTLRNPVAPCHMAIVTDKGILHAYGAQTIHKVVEHALSDKWLKRVEGCFAIPGLT